ncbi:MAG: hypothetical protein FVQ83_10265 [Chloroflexi bacterium]|nr:hypothetical protein [Chloroflexota bacterium]
MDDLAGLLVIGAVVEATVQILRLIWDAGTRNFSITWIVVTALGIVIALMGSQDMVSEIWDLGEVVGQVLTGLVYARFAMFVHDVYKKAA